MKTMKVVLMGDEVQGVRLKGDPKNPEPTYFRVAFPGGDVDVVRTEDGDYWVHVRVNDRQSAAFGEDVRLGKLVDARLDVRSKHVSETDVGDFKHPELYHLAVRVARSDA